VFDLSYFDYSNAIALPIMPAPIIIASKDWDITFKLLNL